MKPSKIEKQRERRKKKIRCCVHGFPLNNDLCEECKVDKVDKIKTESKNRERKEEIIRKPTYVNMMAFP